MPSTESRAPTDRRRRRWRGWWRGWWPVPIAAAVGIASLTTPVSRASFVATTDNPGNSFASANLSPPTGLAAAVSGSDIELTWTATPSTLADGYHVYRSTSSGCCYVLHDTVIGQGSTSYTDVGAVASGAAAFETSSTAANNGTSIVLATPAGTADGDLLVALVAGENDGATLSAPPGWTEVFQTVSPSNFVSAGWVRVAASEPASSTFDSTLSHAMNGAVLRYSNVDPTTPIDVSASTTGFGNPIAPGVTTTVSNATVLRIGSLEDHTVADIGHPAATTARIESDIVPGQVTATADAVQASAGPTGTAAFTGSSDDYVAATLAIAPASSPDYYYVLRAYHLSWESADSNEATATG